MHEAAVYPAEGQARATLMAGRKTLLTPELQRAICDNITAGLNQQDAAELAGVPPSTFYYWLKRGELEQNRLAQAPRAKPRPKETPFLEFLESVKKAQIDFKLTQVKNVEQAAPQHWQASAWLLERRFPKEYGQQVLVRQQVERELEEVLDRLERRLDGATLATVLAVIAGEEGADAPGATANAPTRAA